MIKVGDQAPDFTLKSDAKEDVTLFSFRGRPVLLCFFPSAFSPVCTTEMACFKDDFSEFSGLNVQILAVSVDSHWSHAAFKKSIGASFPFLSDFDKTTSAEYGVLRRDGFSDRAYFLIDKNGIVRYVNVMPVTGTRLENKDLIEAIRKL